MFYRYGTLFGAFFLVSAGWYFYNSEVQRKLGAQDVEKSRLKSELVTERWMQFLAQPVTKDLGGAQVFYMELNPSEFNIVEMDVLGGKREGFEPGDVLREFYSAQQKKMDYFSASSKGRSFFVKYREKDSTILLAGYTLPSVLNFIGRGLRSLPWDITDQDGRVVLSHQASYIGKIKKKKSASWTYRGMSVGGYEYQVGIENKVVKSSSVPFVFGLLGLVFLAGYFFVSRDFSPKNGSSPVVEESIAKNYGAALTVQTTDEEKAAKVKDTSDSSEEDFSGFSISNPTLTHENSGGTSFEDAQVSAEKTLTSDEDRIEIVEDEVEIIDWVRFAEELSENLDQFSKDKDMSDSPLS